MAGMTDKPKNREGDQPMPTMSEESRDVQEALLQMIRERRQVGVQRYGSPLMTHNGRDALQDALEEAVDLAAYLMQLRMERGKEESKGFTYQYLLTYVSDNFRVSYGQEGIITQVSCKQHGLVASFPRERLEHGERRTMSAIGLHMELHDHDEWKKSS